MDPLAEFFLRTAIEGLLIVFYATVVICIVAQRRKKRLPFVSGFFTLYLLQSIADIGLMLVVRTRHYVRVELKYHYFETLTVTRLPSTG